MAHQQDKDYMSKFLLGLSVVVMLVVVVFLGTRLLNVIERAGAPDEPSAMALSMTDDRIRPIGRVVSAAMDTANDGAPASEAQAAPAETPSSTSAAGDASAGQAKYASCAACHGAQGQGQGIFPKLAGTPADRIAELLKKYRAGEQVGPQSALMAPNASGLSDGDIADLAAYIGTF